MMGKQDVMFAGGGEELDWTLSCLCSTPWARCPARKTMIRPKRASRAFDARPRRFCHHRWWRHCGAWKISTTLWHAVRKSITYAEVTGFAATSDGHDMVAPVWRRRRARDAFGAADSACRVAKSAISTPTAPRRPVGDVGEVEAVRRVFGDGSTCASGFSSTKSMTGHASGRGWRDGGDLLPLDAGQGDFITPSINVETLDPTASRRRRNRHEQLVENAGP